jgi:hypothetical protein
MNQSESFTDRTLMPERAGQDIDLLLRDFFHTELPDPWPAPPRVRDKPRTVLPLQRPARCWHQARRYGALAAALALFVLGYWTLGALFPTALPQGLRMNPHETIGNKHSAPNFVPDGPAGVDPKQGAGQNSPETIQVPSGGARVYEQQVGGKTFIRVEALPKP